VQICYILRHPEPHFYSIERLCHVLANEIQQQADVCTYTLPYASSALGAAANLLCLPKTRDTIYHVIGDAHYAALALPKARTVVTFHDAVLLHRLSGLKRRLLLEYSYRRPMRRARVVTTVSEFAKSELEKMCGDLALAVHVVHNPADPAFVWVEPESHRARPRILQVGTAAHKNVDVVIQALAGMECDLHIVGSPDVRLVQLARELGVRVEWHMRVTDQELVDLYATSTLVTFASSYEGFGLPILEAQAVGRPVIASRCCSLPEVAGDAALFVTPGNAAELRSAIQRLLGEPALVEKLVEKGRQNVTRFSHQRIASEYLALYQSLLN
jgi:glycosyltransferase involved in cell wall biosynthesis